MRNIIAFIFLISSSQNIYCQDTIQTSPVAFVDSMGRTNFSSTVVDHISTFGMRGNLEEYWCGVDIFDTLTLGFVVAEEPDLIYIESYYDAAKTKLKEAGYYKLYYINADDGYCWKKSLVWTHYDQNGFIDSKKWFKMGRVL